jgi:hypothetical protein
VRESHPLPYSPQKQNGAPEAQKSKKINVLEALRYHGTGGASTKAPSKAPSNVERTMLKPGVTYSILFWPCVDNHVLPGYSSLPTYAATAADVVSAAILIERAPS